MSSKLKIDYCKTKLVLETVLKEIDKLERLLSIKYKEEDYLKLGVYRSKEISLNNELLKIQGLINESMVIV